MSTPTPKKKPEDKLPMGRPGMISAELVASFSEYLKIGSYPDIAAAALGISRATMYLWLRRGSAEAKRLEKTPRAKPKDSEALYLSFLNAYKQCRAQGELLDLAIITQAAQKGSWQAAAWKRERSAPDRWAMSKREATLPAPGRKAWSLEDPATWSEDQLVRYQETGELPTGAPRGDAVPVEEEL